MACTTTASAATAACVRTAATTTCATTRHRGVVVKPNNNRVTAAAAAARRFALHAPRRHTAAAVRAAASSADDLLVDDPTGLLHRITNDVECVVMDCDGVLWQGDKLLPGVRESIELLRELGKRLVFVTNNSNKSRKEYAHKFEQHGIHVEKEEVFCASFAAAAYLKTRGLKEKAFVVGGRGIVDELNEMQIEVDPGVFNAVSCTEADWEELIVEDDVGAVIVGQDTSFTYAKLAYASLAIQRGATFVATNPDAADLLGPGLMPGAGAIVAAVAAATGTEPEMYAGKPSGFLLELLKGNYVDMAKTLVVGDRLDTDVAFGKAGNAGMTVLTLSGVSTMEDVDDVMMNGGSDAILPDHIVQSLPEMLGLDPEMAGIIEMADVNADDEDDARGAVDEYLEDEGWADDGDEDDEYN